MKRLYSVFDIVRFQKHAGMQKHFLWQGQAFHYIVMGSLFSGHTFFFIEYESLPGNAFRHIRDFFRPKAYTIYTKYKYLGL